MLKIFFGFFVSFFLSGLSESTFADPNINIAINPGHGIVYDDESMEWKWQRAIFHGQREDNITPEFAILLNNLLTNEGFNTFPTRELDKNKGQGESRRQKWQEAAKDYLKSRGDVPEYVWDSAYKMFFLGKDIVSRPIFANHVDADLLINIHTNGTLAGDLTGEGDNSGTSTFYCTKEGYAFSEQSIQLGKIVQTNLVKSIRDRYDPEWKSDGLFGRNHGENCFAQIPSVIVEIAFHDKSYPDAVYLKDHHFRQIVTESIRDSIYEYLLLQTPQHTPPAPEILYASDNESDQFINVTWQAVSSNFTYRLYRCIDPQEASCEEIYSGFDNEFSDSKAMTNTYYYYRLKTCNQNRCSEAYSQYDLGFRGDTPEFIIAKGGSFSIWMFSLALFTLLYRKLLWLFSHFNKS